MFSRVFVFLLVCSTGFADTAEYDVLIRNGTVYDGTGAPAYVADVAVRNDRVVAIGEFESASADLEIDASGLAVAPGFFNVLSHAHLSLLEDWNRGNRGTVYLFPGLESESGDSLLIPRNRGTGIGGQFTYSPGLESGDSLLIPRTGIGGQFTYSPLF